MTDAVSESVRRHMRKVLAQLSGLKRIGRPEHQGSSSGADRAARSRRGEPTNAGCRGRPNGEHVRRGGDVRRPN
jgi:hypothetical protein